MIDPEPFEATEDQFSATLEPGAPETELQMDANHRARARYCDPNTQDAGESEDAPATTATDAGDRISGLLPPRARTGVEREFSERAELEHTLDQQSQFWRDEVASRVDSYRVRRSRKRLAGEFSLKLNFESPSGAAGSRSGAAGAPAHAAAAPLAQAWPDPIPVRAFHDAPEMLEDEDEAQEEDVRSLARRAAGSPKIIAFPGPEFPLEQAVRQPLRQPVFPAFSPADELADPVLDRPRILDAPEDVDMVVADPMSSLELHSKAEEDVTPLAHAAFELPLRVAPLPHRCTAALLDSLLVLVGTAGFAMIVMKTAASMPHTRGALALAVIVPALFWALYHYLFLVHAAMTPGMQMANLSISTFEGKPALRAVRRWRALVMVLSFVSLGLGFVWALFDEDNLCWHDKVTRTYLTMKR